MKKETKQFKKLIEDSKKILILTHQGPDLDAFCSTLLMKKFLNIYYPKKEVILKTNQLPSDNLPYMKEITVVETINSEDEDLVIICDMGTLEKCLNPESKFDITEKKTVYVDHHQSTYDEGDLRINNLLSSATEEVLTLWKDILEKKLRYTKELSTLGQIGIVADTGRFLYQNTLPSTHELMAELKEVTNVDLEDMEYRNAKFPLEAIKPLILFLKNVQIKDDLAYYYLTEDDLLELKDTDTTYIRNASEIVKNSYIKFIQGTHWGFVLRPKFSEENIWQVSFRSTKGYQEVDKICEQLGGGGHKLAAAAKFEATNSQEALEKVLDAIQKTI